MSDQKHHVEYGDPQQEVGGVKAKFNEYENQVKKPPYHEPEDSEIIYRGHGGLIVAHKKVENWKGEMVEGHYYQVGDEDQCLQVTAFQNGPIPDVGRNGTTNEAEIAIVIHRLETLNKLFPCEENERAIGSLKDALVALEERTAKRVQRGVEGKLVA